MRDVSSIPRSLCFVPPASWEKSKKHSCSQALRNLKTRSSYLGQKLQYQVRGNIQEIRTRERHRNFQIIRAAIFGVGAPEALLVGVVALVVFGPKGLAQAVKSLGATLRTFSPTIRELASVTNELSSTLQEQIGLDDIRNEFRNPPPNYYRNTDEDSETSTSAKPDLQKLDVDAKEVKTVPTEDLEAKIAESKRQAWGGQAPGAEQKEREQHLDDTSSLQQTDKEKPVSKKASDLSIDELEAELKRRRDAAKTRN